MTKIIKFLEKLEEKYKDDPKATKIIRKYIIRALDENLSYIPKDLYKRLAKLTKYVNFKCKECGGWCCRNCEGYVGHLDIITSITNDQIEKDILYYAERFDIDWDGFRRENGCILPRHRRSVTCITFACSGIKKYLTDADKLLIKTIINLKKNQIPDDFAHIIADHLEKVYEDKNDKN